MKIDCTQPYVLSHINVELTFCDLEKKFKISSDSSEIFETAKKTFHQAKDIWQPKAVYQWFEFEDIGKDNVGCIIQNTGDHLTFDFGYSFQFLKHAKYTLVSVYTAGEAFEKESKRSSAKGDLLEAYFFDLIGLAVLDQVGQVINGIAEEQARRLGWGVSPFLSPGSVHGWDLEEQVQLCSLLPLEKIDVTFQHNLALSPLKTVTGIIGIGSEYSAAHVGTTCQVCSQKDVCEMKQD